MSGVCLMLRHEFKCSISKVFSIEVRNDNCLSSNSWSFGDKCSALNVPPILTHLPSALGCGA
jgi:hypothetical protein